MFAVIETGGKQYKVQNGDVIYVEKLAQEENSEVKFQVVALGGENGLKKGSKRKMGHRQPYTKVEISAINA